MWKRTAVLKSLSQGQLWRFIVPKTLFHRHHTIAFRWLKTFNEVDQIAEQNAEKVVVKPQRWRPPCRWPHAMWSGNGFQSPVHKEWGGIHFQVFQSDAGLHRKAPPGVWGTVFSCPVWHIGTPLSPLGKTTCRNPAHTTSVLWSVTGSTCLFGEVTGRKTRSRPGLEKSGKILCCRANLQVKTMSVK